MRRHVLLAMATAAIPLLMVAPRANATASASSAISLTGVIVTLDDASGDPAAVAADLIGPLGGNVGYVYSSALRGFSATLPVALLGALTGDARVEAIELDGVVTVSDSQPSPPSYGIDRIDQRNLPLSGSYTYSSQGSGVTAYIIDTGIRATHADFGGRVQPGVNTVDGSPSTEDCNGHGTHVAGTVGGATYGVAKNVSLVAVRVFACANSTTTAAIIAGVDWVTANHTAGTPAVANMSLGGGASAALDTAVQRMINDGVVTAVAAGNDSNNGCNGSPARVANAVVVGATDSGDNQASFSSFGTCVDVHAPGVNIVSAGIASDTASATLSGTSMATPHVTGAAARLLSNSPTASGQTIHDRIVSTATPGVVKGIATTCTFLQNLLGTCDKGTPNRLLWVDPAA